MKQTVGKRGPVSTKSSAGKQAPSHSTSRIAEFFQDPEFRLEWDNDLGFHVARNLQELRRFRDLTQAEVAKRAGVSQPKVALAESGDANISLQTLLRYVEALSGRIRFAIEPAEMNCPQLPRWWDYMHALPEVHGQQWNKVAVKVLVATREDDRPAFFAAWAGEKQPPIAFAEHVTISGGTYLLSPSSVNLTAETTALLTQHARVDRADEESL